MQIIKDYVERGEQIIVCCNSEQDRIELYEYLKSTFCISYNNLELVKMCSGDAFRIHNTEGYSTSKIIISYSEKEWYQRQEEFKHIYMVDWCPDIDVDANSFEAMLMED